MTVDTGEDVEGELLRAFYDDVLPGWVPPDHMMVLWTLEETGRGKTRREGAVDETYA